MTSKRSHGVVTSYYSRAFRIDVLLASFFEPLELVYFRYWQARAGVLISGSTALQFFNRTLYPDSDLDLYVEHRYCLGIAKWLQSTGYAYRPRSWQHSSLELEVNENPDGTEHFEPGQLFHPSASRGYFGRGVANVLNFHKANPNRKIQLITSKHSPLEIILNFHSSQSTTICNILSQGLLDSSVRNECYQPRKSLRSVSTCNF